MSALYLLRTKYRISLSSSPFVFPCHRSLPFSHRSLSSSSLPSSVTPPSSSPSSSSSSAACSIIAIQHRGPQRVKYLYRNDSNQLIGRVDDGASSAALNHAKTVLTALFPRIESLLRPSPGSSSLSPSRVRLFIALSRPLQYFLPANYPYSVRPEYAEYTQWTLIQGILSAATGVLCMQSLLIAVGLSANAALPTAAAINWVLKDGLGQFGGMLLAGWVGRRFDSEAKRWRMLSAIALDSAQILDMITPLVPHLFLPLASIANIGKNVCWLAASASRASIHRALQLEENLADITAKSGAQTIAVSLIGTAVGIMISYFLGTVATAPVSVFSAFAALTAAHLYANYRALVVVHLSSLNRSRAEMLISHFLSHQRVPSVNEIGDAESFIANYRSPWSDSSSLPSFAPLETLAPTKNHLDILIRLFQKEKFFVNIKFHKSGVIDLSTANDEPTIASIDDLLASLPPFEESKVLSLLPSIDVLLLYHNDASSEHALRGYLYATYLRYLIQRWRLLSNKSSSSAITSSSSSSLSSPMIRLMKHSLLWLDCHWNDFLDQCTKQGWNTEHLFLEDPQEACRVEITNNK